MVKSHRSKRHHKKHRGGEGEATDNNSVLNMDEAPVSATATVSASAPASASAPLATAAPAEEEKKGLMDTVKGWFGGSKTKRVRFRMTRKTKRSGTKSKRSAKRSTKRKSAKRSGSKRSGSKRSSAKRSSAKRKSRSKSSSRK